MIEMHQAVACSRRRARVSLVAYKSQRGGKKGHRIPASSTHPTSAVFCVPDYCTPTH